ncbi:MAG: DUF732 domain-containing protein [Mycobacterium sp.]|uniref:DUF732 domain-containing protein n=1 Tax=Mycobacterium sp. TaxID=1785 RepID=UPI003C5AAA25
MAAFVAITLSPQAYADSQNDQMFISFLDGHDISARIPDMNNAVQSGYLACRELAAGKPEIDVELDVSGANPPGLSRADSSWVIAAAKKAFCPGL